MQFQVLIWLFPFLPNRLQRVSAHRPRQGEQGHMRVGPFRAFRPFSWGDGSSKVSRPHKAAGPGRALGWLKDRDGLGRSVRCVVCV